MFGIPVAIALVAALGLVLAVRGNGLAIGFSAIGFLTSAGLLTLLITNQASRLSIWLVFSLPAVAGIAVFLTWLSARRKLRRTQISHEKPA